MMPPILVSAPEGRGHLAGAPYSATLVTSTQITVRTLGACATFAHGGSREIPPTNVHSGAP